MPIRDLIFALTLSALAVVTSLSTAPGTPESRCAHTAANGPPASIQERTP